jgi:Protein of unknown function (DUF2924)
MAPRRHSSDVGENRPLPASSPREAESLTATVAGLADLNADQLRLQWRNRLGGTVPAHLPRWLLLKVLAYRLQADALGDLDKASLRVIRASQGATIDSASGRPFNNRTPRTRDGIGLNPGALLVREWKGKLERVMVLDKGFAWNGRTFGSLSRVAKAVTGTSWNGHRFFGLRSEKERGAGRREARPNADENRRPGAARSKDLGRAESSNGGREGSKGIGPDETERPVAKAKYPRGHLTRCRVSISEPKPPVPVEGEPRQDRMEVCP